MDHKKTSGGRVDPDEVHSQEIASTHQSQVRSRDLWVSTVTRLASSMKYVSVCSGRRAGEIERRRNGDPR
ncbi:hypothetical protein DPEC_G00273070 [Dallia pectoralis]|uniref:Uncharacterized protein n=1 Tax=Dallia pectoralis TaxID=75939 RepID=A0ACC2FQ79_DALPE|nr:hypothetical protein DPEC_G00273070 [Dallia pectoralis]